jgi:hypothetical protein
MLVALGLIVLMVAPGEALSKNFFDGDTAHVIPYDEGDFVRYPEPAGAIHLEGCRQTYKGAYFTFKIDVFPTAWRPVYSIELTGLYDNQVDAVECPAGWTAEVHPQAYDKAPGRVSFYTDSNPVAPGSELAGFTLLSHSNRAVLRWYATGKEGIMLGRVTRTVFVCHTATVPDTWGSIKSMYR